MPKFLLAPTFCKKVPPVKFIVPQVTPHFTFPFTFTLFVLPKSVPFVTVKSLAIHISFVCIVHSPPAPLKITL